MKFVIGSMSGKKTVMKVKEAVKEGKSIYKDIKGHGNEINEILIDLPDEKTGFTEHIVCKNILYPGKINGEFKMTRGHSHDVEEIYIVLSGRGMFVSDKKKFLVKKGDLVTVPKGVWHRSINTGKTELVFLTVFQKHGQSHLKSY